MEYPANPTPAGTGHYGKNGAELEGVPGRTWGYVEYEKELPGSEQDAYGLVPGPSPKYYPINEDAARRGQEHDELQRLRRWLSTWDYRLQVDQGLDGGPTAKSSEPTPFITRKSTGSWTPMPAGWPPTSTTGTASAVCVPPILIAGGSNFPVRKKERQNAASDPEHGGVEGDCGAHFPHPLCGDRGHLL